MNLKCEFSIETTQYIFHMYILLPIMQGTLSKHLIGVVMLLFHICHSNWHDSHGYDDSLLSIIYSPNLHCFEFKHLSPCFVFLYENFCIKSLSSKTRDGV